MLFSGSPIVGPSTVPFVQEVTVAAPDIIRLEIRDPVIQRGLYQTLSSADAGTLSTWVSRTNPNTNASQMALVERYDKKILRFTDTLYTNYYNRSAGDTAGNWLISGGLSVTNVYRKSWPYCEGIPWTSGQSTQNSATFRHYVWLKLSGNLSSGTTYTITPAGALGLSSQVLAYNDSITRACPILFNQQGIRPVDDLKLGYLSHWIPGYGTEGQVNYSSTYSISAFSIIDSLGASVYTGGSFSTRATPTQIESGDGIAAYIGSISGTTLTLTTDLNPNAAGLIVGTAIFGAGVTANTTITAFGSGTGRTGTYTISPSQTVGSEGLSMTTPRYYANTTTASKVGSAMTNANPGVFTSNSHGFSNGDFVQLFGWGVSGGQGAALGYCGYPFTISDASTNTFTLTDTLGIWAALGHGTQGSKVDTTSVGTYGVGTFIAGYDSIIAKCHPANRAGTYVYGLDFSGLSASDLVGKTGPYRIKIAGLGVSDSFDIKDSAPYTIAGNSCQGYYNQLASGTIDGRFGYVRPTALVDGTDGIQIFTSTLPMGLTSEDGGYTNQNGVDQAWIADPLFITSNRAPTGLLGSWHDAGDWCTVLYYHVGGIGTLMDLAYEYCPTQTTSFNYPKMSTIYGATYSASDSLPDAVQQAIHFMEFYRQCQDAFGAVPSGTAFCPFGGGNGFGDGGWSELAPSCSPTGGANPLPIALSAPDHTSGYGYASGAAGLAITFYNAGLTTLANLWKASAELSFAWCEGIYQGILGGDINFYYNTTAYHGTSLGLSAKLTTAGAPTSYANYINGLQSVSVDSRCAAAASLFRMAGVMGSSQVTYKAIVEASPANGGINGNAQGAQGGAAWNYYNSVNATASVLSNQNWPQNGINGANGAIGGATAASNAYYTYYGGMGAGFDISRMLWAYMTTFQSSFNGSISGNTLTVASTFMGTIAIGQNLQDYRALLNGRTITAGSGSSWTISGSPITMTTQRIRGLSSSDLALQAGIRKMMQAAMNTGLGANPYQLAFTTGMGKRNTLGILHRDWQALGGGNPPPTGLTTYTWNTLYSGITGLSGTFNNNSSDSPANFTVQNVTGSVGTFGVQRSFYPNVNCTPMWECVPENSYCITNMEFTTQQTICPQQALAMWLWSWDGNSSTT